MFLPSFGLLSRLFASADAEPLAVSWRRTPTTGAATSLLGIAAVRSGGFPQVLCSSLPSDAVGGLCSTWYSASSVVTGKSFIGIYIYRLFSLIAMSAALSGIRFGVGASLVFVYLCKR